MTVTLLDNRRRIDSPAARTLAAAGAAARTLGLALLLLAIAIGMCAAPAAAADETADQEATEEAEEQPPAIPETPLYDQDPYDLIRLKNRDADEPPLKVEPLKLKGRRVPKYLRPTYRFKIVLWDEPEKEYEVRWASIEKIELFEELVLNKAKELTAQGKREQAYNYFDWLMANDPELPGLKRALGDYLYHEAGIQSRKANYYGALAILMNLCDHDLKHPKLSRALGIIEDKLLEQCDKRGDYATARALLRNLRERFPDHPTAVKWETDLQGRAGRHLAAAREAVGQGKFREADRAMQQVVLLWPELPGAREMLTLLNRRYPRVTVGINAPAATVDPRYRWNWPARRSSRLVYRTLTEFLGPGSEGGNYECPVGTIEIEPLQRRMIFQIAPDLHWATGKETLTGVDVARQLVAMAEPQNPQYCAPWAELFDGAVVRDVYHVEVGMRRPHVRPDSLLQVAITPPGATPETAPPNGPYLVDEQTSGRGESATIYVYNPQYFAATTTQPKEIVERYLEDDRKVIRALRDGRIKVLDRLYPWTLHEFRSMPNVVVERYAAPLVHCLIPNRNRPMMDKGVMRRAIVYGINRPLILKHLMGNNPIAGCSVISGPFPKGASYDDPLGYAYDLGIEPRPYEPGLAVMLATYVANTTAEAAEAEAAKRGEKVAAEPKPPADKDAKESDKDKKKVEKKILVKLTLAHPPHEIARSACKRIQKQLKIVGIDVKLRELPPGPVERMPDDVDLLYAELPMWEPVLDSRELLGPDGLSGKSSVYMNQVLRQLRHATDWRQMRPILRRIHRIAHNDVAIIPLWQMVDHFAYHKSLKGIGTRPVSLYENVELWQLELPPAAGDGTSTAPVDGSLHLAGVEAPVHILTQTSSETE